MFYTTKNHEELLSEIRPIRSHVDNIIGESVDRLMFVIEGQREEIKAIAKGMSVQEFTDTVMLSTDAKLSTFVGNLWNKIDEVVKNLAITIEVLKDNQLSIRDVEQIVDRKLETNNKELLTAIKQLVKPTTNRAKKGAK